MSAGAGNIAAAVAEHSGKLTGERGPGMEPDMAGSDADSESELEAQADAENALSRPLSQALVALNRLHGRR